MAIPAGCLMLWCKFYETYAKQNKTRSDSLFQVEGVKHAFSQQGQVAGGSFKPRCGGGSCLLEQILLWALGRWCDV